MTMTLSGSGTIAGLVAGGLPDASITTDDIAANAITQPKLGSGIAGQGPAFSAYQSVAQTSIASGTWTKVTCQTEEFDTNSNYDNSTNYRFTPTVAGYYQVNGAVYMVNNAVVVTSIYKNGSSLKRGQQTNTTVNQESVVSALVYCNGSTDYIELYMYSGGSVNLTSAGADLVYFQASLVRAA